MRISSAINIESTTIQSIYERDRVQLENHREKYQKEKIQIQMKSIKNTDIIRLNVGGELIVTTRETLTRFSKSILSMMFNGRWEKKLPLDQNRNIFLDFNPILFRHLLDQLQTLVIKDFSPPLESSLVEPYKKMLRKLSLHRLLPLEKNIISYNVGGHIITNQQKTFTQVLSSNITKLDQTKNLFVDSDPKVFQHLINQLREEPSKDISHVEDKGEEYLTLSYVHLSNILLLLEKLPSSSKSNIKNKWMQNGITIAGGYGEGNKSYQFNLPHGIYIDDEDEDDQRIYIADWGNHRIVEWKFGAKIGEVVAGGNGEGNRNDQLHNPRDVIVDKKNDSFIICDYGNRRIVRWPRQYGAIGETIISDIRCWGLAMDNNRDLYVSDERKHEVKRWKTGEKKGTLVAGGNGRGKHLNQLNDPTYIFVDRDYSVYVSDFGNNRVMKWTKDAKEGIIVAGGRDEEDTLTQISFPYGIILDQLGRIYVTDSWYHRIMRWTEGIKQGSIIVGKNGYGKQANQLHLPTDISFDREGNLYVVDRNNHRVQKLLVDSN